MCFRLFGGFWRIWVITNGFICFHNNHTQAKHFWSKILSATLTGSKSLMTLAILSCLSDLWKVCYNKLNQRNFQKLMLKVNTKKFVSTSGHTKVSISEILRRFLKTVIMGWYMILFIQSYLFYFQNIFIYFFSK